MDDDGVARRAVSLSSSSSLSLLIVVVDVFDFKPDVKSLNSELEQHVPKPTPLLPPQSSLLLSLPMLNRTVLRRLYAWI